MTATYNTDLLKSTGLIQETLVLLDAYNVGQSKEDFSRYVNDKDLLGKATQNRVNDILRSCFFKRYVSAGPDTVTALKYLQSNHIGIEVLNQLFMMYTCRANVILADFIRQTYWPKAIEGTSKLLSSDPIDFIHEAMQDGRITKVWSNSTIQKVSEHIIACLSDFRLIEKNKTIRHFSVLDAAINFLLHEGHFNGLSDMQLFTLTDWTILGLSKDDLIKRINRIAQRGHFIAQYSGEILTISWSYKNLLEAAHGISQS